MGYIAGAKGVSRERRREILRIAIQHPWSSNIRRELSDAQLSEWGDPGQDRYGKIVTKLKAQIDNARSTKDRNMSDAIQDWEADLAWLEKTFGEVYGSR
jgi:hypothetical protein